MFKFKSIYRNSRTQECRSLTYEFSVPSCCIMAGEFDLKALWVSAFYQSLNHLEPHEVLIDIQILRKENNQNEK